MSLTLQSNDSPEQKRPGDTSRRPIFVDLDGTLIAADLGQEAFFMAVAARPQFLLTAPFHAARGWAHLKSHLAKTIIPAVESLPYNKIVLAELQRLKDAGHPLILTTASHRAWAEPLAQHLDLFVDVLATDGITNLKGANKLAAIEQYCQSHGWAEFEYWGDAAVDLRIWSAPTSARIVAVNPSIRTLAAIRATHKEMMIFETRSSRWRGIWRALRPQQWIKNLLLFVPLLLSHQWNDATKIAATLWAFVAFSLTASAVYVLNDTFDARADRLHPEKRLRPFAAGTLPLSWGPLLSLTLLFAGQLIVWTFLSNAHFSAMRCSLLLLGYVGLNCWYSLSLKRRIVVDVVCLASMYTLRILFGGIAADVEISKWLLAFSIFFFTSLAFVKRYAELARLAEATLLASPGIAVRTLVLTRDQPDLPQISSPGRGYAVHDLSVISSIGPTCGFMAILVLALYINSPQMALLYNNTFPLWMICPVLMYWITRIWFIAHRNELNEDPIVFAIKDRISWGVGFLMVGLALCAKYLEHLPPQLEHLFGL